MLLNMLGFLRLTVIDILDIILVAALLYFLFRWIKGTSAMNIFLSIVILLVVRFVAETLDMKMVSSVLGTVIDVGAIAIIVIFQPEIRNFLNRLGSRAGSTLEEKTFLARIIGRKGESVLTGSSVSEIAQAVWEMGAQKTGALILLKRRDSLTDIIGTGDTVDAKISCRLLENIFFKNSPLHDGAVVIGSDRIVAARCTLPMTQRLDLPAQYGMRHKAAVGVSEMYDVDVIVVSEQRGTVSFVRNGRIEEISSLSALKLHISNQGSDGQ